MTVRRIVGTETEFGITGPSHSIADSARIVEAYAAAGRAVGSHHNILWDYHGEDPLNDARGFRLERAAAHPSQLTDNPDLPAPSGGVNLTSVRRPSSEEVAMPRAANSVLTNGARFYVDHAHPEYSGPETLTPRDALLWDRAGDAIAREAMALAEQSGPPIVLYKNNVDGKGASYGSHENYAVSRDVDFQDIVRYLTPFFVTRQILCGAGRVGLGQKSEAPGFQISQRADYVENDVGLETTFNRPIINSRDEPHASNLRRLHVIGGDANLFDASILLKIGTTSLVLWLLERGAPMELDALDLDDPVGEMSRVSHDVTLTYELSMRDGTTRTALDIQRVYLTAIRDALAEEGEPDEETAEILTLWDEVLTALETDMSQAAHRVEWVAKYVMLSALKSRESLTWDAAKIHAFDLQWHDLRPGRSIVDRLDQAGRIERFVSDEAIHRAVAVAPTTTRAYLRGALISRFPEAVVAAGWDGITCDIPGAEDLTRVSTPDPYALTQSDVGEALMQPDIVACVDALSQPVSTQKGTSHG